MDDPKQAARLRALTLVDIVPSVAARWAEAPVLTAQAGEGEVLVYGPIISEREAAFAREFLGIESATGEAFRSALAAIRGDVTVRINSPGGDVHEASTMLTALQERRSRGAEVNVVIDGLAASAASVLLTAASTVRIAALGMVVIHEMRMAPGAVTGGEMRRLADFLDEMNERFTALYAARMKRSEADVRALLAEEHSITHDIHGALVEGGRLVIIDFDVGVLSQVLSGIGIDRAWLIAQVTAGGFELVSVEDWPGWGHYAVVFEKSGE